MTKPEAKQLSVLSKVATKYSMTGGNLLSTLSDTIFPSRKSATPEQVQALLIVADQYNLNPFTKEVYAFPGKGGGIMPVVSVDGWLKLANSHPMFDGMDIKFEDDKDLKPISCTCTIYRKDRGHPIQITEYYSENRRMTDPWKTNPHRMLRHRAIIQAIRVAFSFSGIYLPDEVEAMSDATQDPREAEVIDVFSQALREYAEEEPEPKPEEEAEPMEVASKLSPSTEAAADELFAAEDTDWVD
jgi:phage recombination protein Bet